MIEDVKKLLNNLGDILEAEKQVENVAFRVHLKDNDYLIHPEDSGFHDGKLAGINLAINLIKDAVNELETKSQGQN